MRKGYIEITERILQRSKILTWKRKDKEAFIEENNIGVIVNFWPKVDPDFTESENLDWYLFVPTARSEDMVMKHVLLAAKSVAEYIRNTKRKVLVLCEAGKTRSVFFCVLLVAELDGLSLVDAYLKVEDRVPEHRMKDWMYDWVYKNHGV